MMWGYGWDMGWWWLIGLLVLIGFALLVIFVVLAVRLLGRNDAAVQGPGSARGSVEDRSRARQILDERFAAGELTAEQYREHVRVLREHA